MKKSELLKKLENLKDEEDVDEAIKAMDEYKASVDYSKLTTDEYKNRGRIKEYTQELVLDHDEKGNPDAFITSQSVDIHGFWDNDVVENIKYCPFCGQKLY